jgi:predicted DNA-binding protein with PD1-like motif
MRSALLHEADGLRTFVVVLSTDDEVMATLGRFASEQRLKASQFSAIGAFSRLVVAFFDWKTKDYQHRPIDEQVEVLSLLGDVTLDAGVQKIHAHVVVGKADGTAHGGHLIEAHVRPTLEVMFTELPRHLCRRFDPTSGLTLIEPK